MSAIENLPRIAREYEEKARAFAAVADAAAVAEADYKSERARAILRHRAAEGVRSHAEAETRADAEDHIADLLMRRLTTAAEADAHREDLRRLREHVAAVRSAVTSERHADEFHARGYTGAA